MSGRESGSAICSTIDFTIKAIKTSPALSSMISRNLKNNTLIYYPLEGTGIQLKALVLMARRKFYEG